MNISLPRYQHIAQLLYNRLYLTRNLVEAELGKKYVPYLNLLNKHGYLIGGIAPAWLHEPALLKRIHDLCPMAQRVLISEWQQGLVKPDGHIFIPTWLFVKHTHSAFYMVHRTTQSPDEITPEYNVGELVEYAWQGLTGKGEITHAVNHTFKSYAMIQLRYYLYTVDNQSQQFKAYDLRRINHA